MNPYERRVIHFALQNDRYVTTHSEGEGPNRHVVVTLDKDAKDYGDSRNRKNSKGYRGPKDSKSHEAPQYSQEEKEPGDFAESGESGASEEPINE